MAYEINKVGVVGLGTMGAGIVEVFARTGHSVIAVEIDDAALERGRANLIASTERALSRGKLTEADRDSLLGRISFGVGLDILGDADLVIEVAPERLELKRAIFTELDRLCRPEAILATNTSSLSVTEIAATTGRPERVLGMHFFNPAPVMRLVEVVTTVVTQPEVAQAVHDLCQRLDKVGVRIGDRAGFIANALLFGYLNQAVSMYEAAYATREDIDNAMRLGAGLPMGPLTLLDLIGLDVGLEILETMYAHGGRDRRHAPAPMLRRLVTAGLLGRKAGRGFYSYQRPGSATVVTDGLTPAGPESSDTSAPGGAAAGRVSAIGLVGVGALLDPLAVALTKAGYEVTAVPWRADGDPLGEVRAADLVITAAPDDLAERSLFAALDEVCRPATVMATTSSSLPVIECAMATTRPSDVVGLHLLGPSGDAGVIEVGTTAHTGEHALAVARDVAKALGKTPVMCFDRAGFVVNALLFGYLNDAVRMLESGYASVDDIDNAMRLGCGYSMGPFELLDEVGLDVVAAGLEAQHQQTREPSQAPAPLLVHLVAAGLLGRKAGRGFRDHAHPRRSQP